MFLIIAQSCSSCNLQTVKLFNEIPSEEEINNAKSYLGNMYCIKVKILDLSKTEYTDFDFDE